MEYLYLLFLVICIILAVKYFWPIFLVLFLVIIGIVMVLRHKVKVVTKQAQEEQKSVEEDYGYNKWNEGFEEKQNPDVIDVEYTEHEDK